MFRSFAIASLSGLRAICNRAMTNAIILAGGFGTRLRKAVPDLPKPLAPVGGRPFISMQLDWLAKCGVDRVTVTAHYMADKIQDFVSSLSGNPLPVDVVVEHEPLGTGGAVVNAFREIGHRENTVVLNGDTYYSFDLSTLVNDHNNRNALLTMAVELVDDCARYGTVAVEGGKAHSFIQASGKSESGFVNCGIYVMSPEVFDMAPDGPFSIEVDLFADLAARGLINVLSIAAEEPFFDIGTPEAYAAFCKRYN